MRKNLYIRMYGFKYTKGFSHGQSVDLPYSLAYEVSL